jgi:hypothetical protein
LAERVLGKDEVTSSILVIGSIRRRALENHERALARCRAEAAVNSGAAKAGNLRGGHFGVIDNRARITATEKRRHGERKI